METIFFFFGVIVICASVGNADLPDHRLFLFQVYVIEVTDGEHKWKVKHRYSDFHDLHEKVRVSSTDTQAYLP